jgi:hypothetical protein
MVFCFNEFSLIFSIVFFELDSIQEFYNRPNETKIKLHLTDGHRKDILRLVTIKK